MKHVCKYEYKRVICSEGDAPRFLNEHGLNGWKLVHFQVINGRDMEFYGGSEPHEPFFLGYMERNIES